MTRNVMMAAQHTRLTENWREGNEQRDQH
jgi:hypothetical protein